MLNSCGYKAMKLEVNLGEDYALELCLKSYGSWSQAKIISSKLPGMGPFDQKITTKTLHESTLDYQCPIHITTISQFPLANL